jgi:tRNA A-37 threonylcarbamoyl transferase component Bud32
MPVKPVKRKNKIIGYKWGSKGKVYSTKKDAEKQARAAYANGYQGSRFLFEPIDFAKKEEKISVGKHRRGKTWIQPFIRRQKVNVENNSDKNKRNAALALGAIVGVQALLNAKNLKNSLSGIGRKVRKARYRKASQKYLPAPKIGEGVYGEVQDIAENQVGKVYRPFKSGTQVNIDAAGNRAEKRIKLFSEDVKTIISGRNKEFALMRELADTGVVPKVGSKGKFGFTMEKIRGESLHDFVHSTLQNPSDEQLLELGRKAGEALKKVHGKGILHGDLHANNIIVDNKGNLKIIDFGLGKKSKYKPGTPGFLREAALDQTRLVSGGFSQNKKWREKFSEGFYERYKL